MTNFVGVVLAAGQGTRMKSALPKVLHRIAGKPMVAHAVDAALQAGASRCVVVVGHGREQVETELTARFGDKVSFALQAQQLGTGHAVRCAIEQSNVDAGLPVLVLYGDCPLLEASTLARLTARLSEQTDVALLTSELADPTGYGRILRSDTRIVGIREQKDCSANERAITEVNPGIYVFRGEFLRREIQALTTNNAQGEFYLTDLVARAGRVESEFADITNLRGVNDRLELATCATLMRRRINMAWAKYGVTFEDIDSVSIDADVTLAEDVTLERGVVLRGKTVVEREAVIGVGSVLTDVVVREGAHLLPYSVASKSEIGAHADVGPFSHLRPETKLGSHAKVGNFCETKKTTIGDHSKVNHLAYVGDGQIGDHCNIGAGTIFCNYDGFRKHTTVLEDGVFIGSDSQLVAPVTIGKGAYVGSGSTITRDVPADALALSRTKQENREGYAGKLRARFGGKTKE